MRNTTRMFTDPAVRQGNQHGRVPRQDVLRDVYFQNNHIDSIAFF